MVSKTKGRHDLPTDPDKLRKLCEDLGWEVKKSTIGHFVDNRHGDTASIPMMMQGRSRANTHAAMRRLGIDAAIDAYEEQREKDRREAMQRDAAAMDRRLEQIQKEQEQAAKVTNTPGGRPTDGILWLGDGEDAPYVMRVLVTPALAMEWLTRPLPYLPDGKQLKQRTLDTRFVEELKNAIRNNEWLETHQGIALASAKKNTGGVADGQHRLNAVAEMEDELYEGSPLGAGVWMRVTFQEDPSKFRAYDIGRRRSAAQLHHIEGEKNTASLSSALKMLVVWQIRAGLPPGEPHPLLDRWTSWTNLATQVRYPQEQAAGKLWTNQMVDGVWYPDIRECLRLVSPLSVAPVTGNRAGLAVFVATAMHAWPEGEADLGDFLKVVATGLVQREGDKLVKGDPRNTFRNWLLAQRYKKEWRGQAREVSLYTAHTLWAAYNQGRTITNMRIMDDYEMPYAYKPKSQDD